MFGRQSHQRSSYWRLIGAALAAALLGVMVLAGGEAQACPPGGKPTNPKSIAQNGAPKPQSSRAAASRAAPVLVRVASAP